MTRTVGLWGATGIGAGAMLGAGVFAVWGPATERAGTLLIWAVSVASVVAVLNALSTAQLASVHPVAGGAYTFGRREAHRYAGFVAGIGFVVGKTASVAAIALAIGSYVWPEQPQAVAAIAIVVGWALNARGVTRTAAAATVVAVGVVLALTVFMVTAVTTPRPSSAGSDAGMPQGLSADASGDLASVVGVLGAAGLVFFAFAGYARIATLGEEVRDPSRVIPRAIVLALGAVLVMYLALAVVLLSVVGPEDLVASTTPVADLVAHTPIPSAVVAVVAAVAAFGSLVALMAGVGRTAMAMGREGDLPRALARQGGTGVPWLAEAVSGALALVLVAVGDLGFAIAMSSFAVLVYYGVANVSAARARRAGNVAGLRLWSGVSMTGAVLCALLAVALPWQAIMASAGAMAVSLAVRALLDRRGIAAP